MANSGPNTNKAQFFITYACVSISVCQVRRVLTSVYSKQPHLDGKYTILGRHVPPSGLPDCSDIARSVIDGADTTLDIMERMPVGAKYRPNKGIKLQKVRSSLLLRGDDHE